jgi:hypothetical protein
VTTIITEARCHWCGELTHQGKCPLIKAVEFHEDGVTTKRIEFWTRAELDRLFSPHDNLIHPKGVV